MLLYTSAMLLWVSTDILSNEIPLLTGNLCTGKSLQRCIALIMALPFAHIEQVIELNWPCRFATTMTLLAV